MGSALRRVRSEPPPPLTDRGEPPVSPAFGPHKGEGDKRGSVEPLPLVGRGRGGGRCCVAQAGWTPTPTLRVDPPRKGEGKTKTPRLQVPWSNQIPM